MLAGSITGPSQIELIDIDEPKLERDGDLIFQPELACLCGSDVPFFEGTYTDSFPLKTGHSLHEMIGTVVESRGKKFQAGDRVLAVPVDQVGFFERYAVAEDRVIPLDPRPKPEHGLLAQPLGTALYALRKLPNFLGLSVAIVGQGPMGQLLNASVSNLGARQIIGIDQLASRLATSPSMGAHATIDSSRDDPTLGVMELTKGKGADVVIEAVGHEHQTLDLCVSIAAQDAHLLSFGVPPEERIEIDWRALFFKNIRVYTSVNPDFDLDFPLAMQWIAEGRIDVAPIVTHRMPVAEVQTAFEIFRDRRDGAQKVFLDFPAGR